MWDDATVIVSVSKTKTRYNFSVRFLETPADTTYTESRRLAPEYMASNTHTHQRTQLTIVTNIIEREFVAAAILSYNKGCCLKKNQTKGCCYCFSHSATRKKTTLHGGHSRSWSAEQGKENKIKSLAVHLPPPPQRCSLLILNLI